MKKYRFFFVMFVIGTLLGGSAYSQGLSADPHNQDFGVAAPLITQHVVVTQYITGDPHQYDSVDFPDQQMKVRTAYSSGDPHDDGQLVPVLPVERKAVVIPYLIGDPHAQEESDLLLALE